MIPKASKLISLLSCQVSPIFGTKIYFLARSVPIYGFIVWHKVDHADFEMYRDRERNHLTRLTQFRGIYPICSADAVLRTDQSDHNLQLVGHSVESPFAHVYSFDRVLMTGLLLSQV